MCSSKDISGIEAGHSSIREFTKQRGRGHIPGLEEVSAKSVCRFISKFHGHAKGEEPQHQQPEPQRDEPPEPQRRPPKRTGSGGPWRAFCSCESKGKRLTSDAIQDLKRKYRDSLSPFSELSFPTI